MNNVNSIHLYSTVLSISRSDKHPREVIDRVKSSQNQKSQARPSHTIVEQVGQSSTSQSYNTYIIIAQTVRASGSVQPSDAIPCALRLPVGQPLPCKVGDHISLVGHYESNNSRTRDGRYHLSTYVRVESITVTPPDESLRPSQATVAGYVCRLGAVRTTRRGYTVQDAIIATATPVPDSQPAYLPVAIFNPGKYPRLSLHQPAALTGRLQERRYTTSDGHSGVCWELVPWRVSNCLTSDADEGRLRAVGKHYRPAATAALPCKDETSPATDTLDTWLMDDAFATPLDADDIDITEEDNYRD